MRTAMILMFFVIITNASCAQTTNNPAFTNLDDVSILTKKISPSYNQLNVIQQYGIYIKADTEQLTLFIDADGQTTPLEGVVTNCYRSKNIVSLEGHLKDNDKSEFILVFRLSGRDVDQLKKLEKKQ
ncbi:TPA: hypothetical protein DIC40_02740 [Patescibacteria group bacterium]|nr:hypothetical protein P148_SR1C00001G0187 [candidate division SR1 bacterium RAAC1_SR1_1]HCY20765.1 hypothetical protein [Candidatus Gracilibacteria bacterium]